MKTQHTKGEWTISNCANGGKIVSFGEYKHQIMNIFDAKLIAAAPELLKELMNLVNCWDNDTFQDLDIDYAKDAIKKATS